MERRLLSECLRKELSREEEGKNQSGFPICPFGIAYSALPDTHCTSSTLTSIKVDEEWKSGKGGVLFPTFSAVSRVKGNARQRRL